MLECFFAIPSISQNDFDPRTISVEASFYWMHEVLQTLEEMDVNIERRLARSALLVVNTLLALSQHATRRDVNSIT
jgi:hypothetical protein